MPRKAACDKLVTDFEQLNQHVGGAAKGRPSTAAKPLEETNVTSDSTPGWVPSSARTIRFHCRQSTAPNFWCPSRVYPRLTVETR